MRACVDIGGTKVAVSLSPSRDAPLAGRLAEPTAKTGGNDALAAQILRLIDAACAAEGIDPASVQDVGVASAGPFVLRDGCIEVASPNICGGIAGPARGLPNDWLTAPVEAPLRRRFQRVRMENDAVAALEAERLWGALQGLDHCAYLTWSTGVGVGLCVDGRVLRGKNGNAGHGGHTFVADDTRDALCGCGNVGDVEGLASGTALARRTGRSAKALFTAAQAGEPAALQAIDEACRVVGRLLYNLVVTLDLQCVSLGGGVFLNNAELLLPRLERELGGRFAALTDGSRLVRAGLDNRVGDYAALALLE